MVLITRRICVTTLFWAKPRYETHFILVEINFIFTETVFHLTPFWKWGAFLRAICLSKMKKRHKHARQRTALLTAIFMKKNLSPFLCEAWAWIPFFPAIEKTLTILERIYHCDVKVLPGSTCKTSQVTPSNIKTTTLKDDFHSFRASLNMANSFPLR